MLTGVGRGPGRLLVVGRNSFIARHFLAACSEPLVAVGHDAVDQADLLDGVDRIICFTRYPLLEAPPSQATDPNLRLSERILGRGIDFVMLSSCKVYAAAARRLAESDSTGPRDRYGQHKLAVEQALGARLGARLTILRLANVFGDERAEGHRTFFALMLDRLAREGQIHFDMSPFVTRDFLPVTACARVVARIVAAPPGGILNVGSGIALPTGRVALWLLEGYGRGELVIKSPQERDAFVPDINRLTKLCGAPCSYDELRTSCLDLGRRLRREAG